MAKSKRVLPSLQGYGGTPVKRPASELKKSVTIGKYREEIAAEMLAMGLTSVRDVMDWDEYGNVKIKAAKDIPDYAHKAIKKVTCTTTEGKNGSTTTMSVELHDKVQTMRTLAKAAGLLEQEQNMDKPSVIGFVVNAPEIEDVTDE